MGEELTGLRAEIRYRNQQLQLAADRRRLARLAGCVRRRARQVDRRQ